MNSREQTYFCLGDVTVELMHPHAIHRTRHCPACVTCVSENRKKVVSLGLLCTFICCKLLQLLAFESLQMLTVIPLERMPFFCPKTSVQKAREMPPSAACLAQDEQCTFLWLALEP